ncbi:MAG: YkgJ family cysteine cluster protein [Planctomycetota bacterium]|nr:YkgJ family cysteine cluster protein [Planctomycetaceae bacterium]MDQ3333076.1 YkgJ family cysteine cluster protein [Planctomycetota bacterium]
MPLPLELPVLQRWGCQSCGECCKRHLVEITGDERDRILSQGWEHDADLKSVRTVVPLGRWSRRWRLNHTADGSCVFLRPDGLCRIHAQFGEAAKPLACRVYPYAFHPSGKRVAVSLRYSCPSVVANHGPTAKEAEKDIRRLAKAVVPDRPRETPPPAVSTGNRLDRLDWPDFRKLIDALDESFADPAPGFLRNLLGAVFWVSLVEQASFEKIRGARLDEFLSLVRPAAAAEVPQDLSEFVAPTAVGHMMFRLLVGQYARLETTADLNHPWRARWRNVSGSIRLTRGKGLLPPLRRELKPVPFEALEEPFGWPAAADELFSRYVRTKVGGMHFCGPAYYDVPFTEGFFALALVVPATLYLARWLAAADDRSSITNEDLFAALAMADHHHGYSPFLAGSSARSRVRALAKGDLPKLCVWYSR